jgi:hypothetical protein
MIVSREQGAGTSVHTEDKKRTHHGHSPLLLYHSPQQRVSISFESNRKCESVCGPSKIELSSEVWNPLLVARKLRWRFLGSDSVHRCVVALTVLCLRMRGISVICMFSRNGSKPGNETGGNDGGVKEQRRAEGEETGEDSHWRVNRESTESTKSQRVNRESIQEIREKDHEHISIPPPAELGMDSP